VFNALSELVEVEVAREMCYTGNCFFSRDSTGKLEKVGAAAQSARHERSIPPDTQIFGGEAALPPGPAVPDGPARKAYSLFVGVEVRWNCDPALLAGRFEDNPPKRSCHTRTAFADQLDEKSASKRQGDDYRKPRSRGLVGHGAREGKLKWGDCLDPRRLGEGDGFCPLLLLNTIPDAGRRHA